MQPSQPIETPAAQGTTIGALEGAVKRYGRVQALGPVDLDLRAGEILALLGPNGAGKTTAVHLLLGLLRPTAGQVRIFGQAPDASAARQRVGAMLQISNVPETLKVREHLELTASYYPRPLPLPEVVRMSGLEGLEERLYGKLSGGQKQRLLFALAICGDPDLLFLDEPTVGLDVAARRSLWEAIRDLAERGKTVLLTTHYLEEADALAHRVALLHRGRLAALGTPKEVKQQTGKRWIRCRTSITPAAATAWPEVLAASGSAGHLEVSTTAPEVVVPRLLALDPELSDLEVTRVSLEDALLELSEDIEAKEEAA